MADLVDDCLMVVLPELLQAALFLRRGGFCGGSCGACDACSGVCGPCLVCCAGCAACSDLLLGSISMPLRRSSSRRLSAVLKSRARLAARHRSASAAVIALVSDPMCHLLVDVTSLASKSFAATRPALPCASVPSVVTTAAQAAAVVVLESSRSSKESSSESGDLRFF